jgi:hypothetical protein
MAKPDVDRGGRFGGPPPKGVGPAVKSAESSYLLTVPWDGGEISIFIGLDSLADGERSPAVSRSKIFDNSAALVQGVFHPPLPRGKNRSLVACEGRALVVEPETEDEEPGFPAISGHKLGGRAVYRDPDEETSQAVRKEEAAGFVHAIQLNFPSNLDDAPSLSWPFDDDLFHVFFKAGRSPDFRFIWG